MLKQLGIASQDSDMSFSVRCERTGLEYQGSSLNGLFTQRGNLLRPAFHGMLRDILRFNRRSVEVLRGEDAGWTMREYLEEERYGQAFIQQYLVPMASAIWSCRPQGLLEFPARFLVAFFRNHGLLQIRDRPRWKTVVGGAKSYVDALLEPLGNRVRLGCGVASVQRHADHVLVRLRSGATELFDHVVFAAHADQVLSMLADADPLERKLLRAFPYQKNEALLHTDTTLLPTRDRAWASWNYHVPREATRPVAVTYDLRRLQAIDAPRPILLTLNPAGRVDPMRVLQRFQFEHPAYRLDSPLAQSRREEINGRRRTWFCGAYWGYGFHEDGVNSALAVAKSFGKYLDSCTVASMKDAYGIDAIAR
jgi:predicted NAD/FAD-binding protein